MNNRVRNNSKIVKCVHFDRSQQSICNITPLFYYLYFVVYCRLVYLLWN